MRARNIKPGFFRNDELAACSWPARLLFIGLWCLADRNGRLEHRPLRIKGEVFPFDNIDAKALLDELINHDFIRPYDSDDGRKLLWIPKFLDHQSPHHNEVDSEFPPSPDEVQDESTFDQGGKCLRPRSPNVESENQRIRESGIRESENQKDSLTGELSTWLAWWNRLRAENLVAVGVDAESPSKAVRQAWKRAQSEREVRDCLADPKLLEKAIRESSFCNAGWFTLPKLLGGKNCTGEYIITRLLEGGYRDTGRKTSQRSSPGKSYDPNATGVGDI